MSKKMRPIKFSATLRYKQITQFQPEDKTVLINKKERICHQVDFAAPVNHRIKGK